MRLAAGFVLALVLSLTVSAQDRRTGTSGDETGRDAVGFRKDAVTKETVGERRNRATTPTTAEAIEDFRQIQKVNRDIIDMLKSEPLALDQLARAAKEVNTRASRLRRSLQLTDVKDEKSAEITPPGSGDELLSLVKTLDENVQAFVHNPRFRGIQPADKNPEVEEREASKNLRQVIEVSRALQQGAEKLRKAGR
jgi:hypothetical protein